MKIVGSGCRVSVCIRDYVMMVAREQGKDIIHNDIRFFIQSINALDNEL